MEITKDTVIADILHKYPDSAKVFNNYRMGCASCLGMQNESLEKAGLMHGLDVSTLVEAIKKAIL